MAGSRPAVTRTAPPLAPLSWLRRRDPELAAVRRAGRVTIAACVGFYVCRYVVGDPTMALYALFGCIALGVLSQTVGPPSQRTRTYGAALAVGLVLATIGTLLAGSTAAAAAGMLVIGFLVAYAGVGGPRVAGVANGLLLLYVLPCFPPYAPDTLGSRITGLVVGVGLLAIADRLLWPAPAPPDFGRRVADAAGSTARYAAALRTALLAGPTDGPDGEHPWTTDPEVTGLRTRALQAAESLRLSNLPAAQRPAGPGVRDRSLTIASASVRLLIGRLAALAALLARPAMPRPSEQTAELVGTVGDALEQARDALSGTGPPPSTDAVDRALAEYVDLRKGRLSDGIGMLAPRLPAALMAESTAESARTLALATCGAVGSPAPERTDTPPEFWFLHASSAQLWWSRLRAHLTPRSVYLQNAVRLAVGLAVARVVAGAFDLSHGFWVLLATLSLMRTSATASRAALVPAFAGTVAGAVVAGGLLTVFGSDTAVYAWVLPVLMIVGFAMGPLLGIAAGQAAFTVVVAVIFAQVAPATWQLAETRLVDVVIGGVIGAVIGAAVWPRGGGGEVRRVAAASLRTGADEIVDTAGFLTGTTTAAPSDPLARLSALFDNTYAQYRSEPMGPAGPDWLAILGVVRRMVAYAHTLRARHPAAGPLPWPSIAVRVREAAADVADAYREVADDVAAGRTPGPAVIADRRNRLATAPSGDLTASPEDALRVLDAWGWLDSLLDDLERLRHALDPHPDPPPTPAAP